MNFFFFFNQVGNFVTRLHFWARNQHNCWLSDSWTDLRSDSFRQECVWHRENSIPTRCVNIRTVPSDFFAWLSVHFCVAVFRALLTGSFSSCPFLMSGFLISLLLSLHLNLFSSKKPSYTPPLLWPEPRQAGFPAVGPDGPLASQPALGLWAGRTALLWLIWRRPVLAPVVTMEQQGDGKAGTQREQCQYTADWGTNCGRTITHRHVARAILLSATRWCDEYDTESPLSWFEFIF